jgi:transcriptional regulator with XRE-family HTH domain
MYKVTLAAARVNVGMSQKQAAKALGVSNRTLCNWEQGVSYPKADKVESLCALYKVPYDMLNFLP